MSKRVRAMGAAITRRARPNQSDPKHLRMQECEVMEAQTDLARLHRIPALGRLPASIAREVTQPFSAAVADSHAASDWLNRESPNLKEVKPDSSNERSELT